MPAGVSRTGSRRITRTNQRQSTPRSNFRSGVHPLNVWKFKHGRTERVPDPIEFVTSDEFLNRPNLYPRQATFLKLMFLREDMFTQYDHDVIGEWEEAFARSGNEGLNPGVLQRISLNKAAGRKWFRETQGVIGRRGSKGYLGGLAGAYVTWNYMHLPGGPQEYYGIDRDKRLTGIVFAGKKEQARDNLWRDWFNVITGAPCFAPYISRPQAERLTIFAPTDLLKRDEQARLGIAMENDIASFEIIPAPSTMMAARGPASFALMFDEQAHVIASTAAADAEMVYDAATPALDQFRLDGFIYAPSSPWRKTGKFFENWELAIEMDTDASGAQVPAYPERLMLQLPSWGIYRDWEDAEHLPLRPPTRTIIEVGVEVKRRRTVEGIRRTVTETQTVQRERLVPGPMLQRLRGAVQTYDEQMQRLERANPETFAVERKSHWAESIDAYLNPKMVDRMFQAWGGNRSRIAVQGDLNQTYMAHGDPATSNKRFGWALGHRLWVPEVKDGQETGEGWQHAVIDLIRCWDPADYEDHILDYDDVMGDIEQDVQDFLPADVSFDQFNVPATIGRLRKFVRTHPMPKAVVVHEVTRTAPLNWKHFEIFKSAVNLGLVHAPMFQRNGEVHYASDQGSLELKFLEEKNGKVDHPDTGPIQSKDIADAIVETTVALIGKQMAAFLGYELDSLGLTGMAPKGSDPYRHQKTPQERLGEMTGDRNATARGMAARSLQGAARGLRRR